MSRPDIRAAVRRARETPGVGWLVRAADRLWWFRVIRRSGLVDADYYAAQLGLRALPADVALAHYVSIGFRRGLSVNPLFDEVTAGGNLPEVFRVPAMYAYLLSDRDSVQVHPLWDAVAYARAHGTDAPVEHAWSTPDTTVRLRHEGVERDVRVSDLRSLATAESRHWRTGRIRLLSSDESAGSEVLLVRPVQNRDRRYALKLAQAARLAERPGVRAVVPLVAPDASQWVIARLIARLHPRVQVRRVAASQPWHAVVRAARRPGDTGVVVVLDPRAEFEDDAVDALVSRARTGAVVAPVQLSHAGTVETAGAARVDPGPAAYPVLREHPPEDLAGWGEDPLDVPMLWGRTFAAPVDAIAVAGASRRGDALAAWSSAMRRRGGRVALLPHVRVVLDEPEYAFRERRGRTPHVTAPAGEPVDRARAEALLKRAGFHVEHWRTQGGDPHPLLRLRDRPEGSQRWAIKICAPPGRRGAVWGDTHFALGLARALRRRGHEVVIDAFGASRRSSSYLDDVSVVIRGPYRIVPPDTGVRIEWIISHPDEITAAEIADFDAVFAASRRWATRASERWGRPIEPLLECTDVDQFHPRGLTRGEDIVFVGTARGIARPSVVAPLQAGIPVKVYGPDWRPFIPASAVVAESIPNIELPARYETASIVLNDQWPAMREAGFIAMRPFDAVAVGARVVSEDVDEIEEIFRGAVVAYRDPAHLVELLRRDPAEIFPPDDEMLRIAEMVRRDHSFDARAATLQHAADRAHRDSPGRTARQ